MQVRGVLGAIILFQEIFTRVVNSFYRKPLDVTVNKRESHLAAILFYALSFSQQMHYFQ